MITEYAILSNGIKMPGLGLGVFKVADGDEVENAVRWALETGYRHIDTAALYGNERGVGRAVRGSGIPREDIFITTKVWNSDQGFDTTLSAFEKSLERLEMKYVDLYLVHWPVQNLFIDTWRALESIYKQGLAKAIGTSNFLVHHLRRLMDNCEIPPMVNQVELHPFLLQPELLRFCLANKIQPEAWAPLTRGEFLDHPVIAETAKKYGKTPAQVLLRWDIQHDVVTIPKSVHRERIIENASIFDFEIGEEDMKRIDSLDEGRRIGPDPDNFNF
jgi:diketogulonate reductase-like aldo/keto reductase